MNNIEPLKPFRFWAQKVIPLVYDESLSYYELLCKVIDYLNKMGVDFNELLENFIEFANDMTDKFNDLSDEFDDLSDDFADLKTWAEQEFPEFVSDKLDEMAEDGTLTALIAPYLPFVTPEMFGAVGDGETDDTNAFIQCMLNKNIVFTPGKTYLIKSNIDILAETTITGNNASVLFDDATAQFSITGNNVSISDIRLFSDGEKSRYGVEVLTGVENTRINNLYGEHLTNCLILEDGINTIIENCYALECGWDCVTNYSSSKNAIVQNCVAIRCGRHGFSTESDNAIWINCYAEDIGFIDGEGHSSFHFERANNCSIINCKARYTTNHKMKEYTGSQVFYGFRIDTDHNTPSLNNKINGLEIIYENDFSFTKPNLIKPISINADAAAIRPTIHITNIKIENKTTQTYESYLGFGTIYFNNFSFIGRLPFVQKSDYGLIKELTNGFVDMNDQTIYFYEAVTIAEGVLISNVKAKNCKALIRGRLVNCNFENCYVEDSETSFYLTQTQGDSTKKSSGNIIKNNTLKNLTNGISLGWWTGEENNIICDNLFTGTITTVLHGNYCGCYFYNNIERDLTYTNLKDNVTVTTTPPTLVIT